MAGHRVDYTQGWTPDNQYRLKQLAEKPDWRCVDNIQVEYTILKQQWNYVDTSVTLQYIMPWGMRKTMTKNYAATTCKTYEVLPRTVRLKPSVKIKRVQGKIDTI